MNVLLLSLNAKYIHSSLATRYIKAYCAPSYDIDLLELTINHEEMQILKEVYKKQPDILGISCYIWNMRLVKQLIPLIKKVLPKTTIVLGGPEVSYESTRFLKELDVDIVCIGEGEATWLAYLDAKTNGYSLSTVAGIAYKCDTKIVVTEERPPLPLEDIPFVYEGLEDLTHRIIYYESSRGCPFQCQYCLSSIERGVRFLPLERAKKEIDYFLAHSVPQVKFVDRTFNASKKYAIEIWQHIISHDNGITNFHFEIAAERLTPEMIHLLKDARDGLIQFEIGVQSTNNQVLEIIKRPMAFDKIRSIVTQISELKSIHQHLDLIAGLPYENYASFKQSFNDVISLRPEQFQLGFLKLLDGSGMKRDALKYGIVYQEEPPYEVLYTDALSYEELLLLHDIEEMLERYYNSERFTFSLAYLYTLFPTPFDCFENLARFWTAKGYDKIKHKKDAYYKNLLAFGETLSNVDIHLLKECIRFDWLLHEKVKEIPSQLETYPIEAYKDSIHATYRDEEWLHSLSSDIAQMSPKQRMRALQIDFFSYDMWQLFQAYNQDKTAPLIFNRMPAPIGILFDHTLPYNACYKIPAIKENE